jgi:hypothetical protein
VQNIEIQSTLDPIWNITLGGSSWDRAYSITVDDSYIYVTGYTYSFGAGSADAFVLKTDLEGRSGMISDFAVLIVLVIMIVVVFASRRVKL